MTPSSPRPVHPFLGRLVRRCVKVEQNRGAGRSSVARRSEPLILVHTEEGAWPARQGGAAGLGELAQLRATVAEHREAFPAAPLTTRARIAQVP